MALLTKYFKHIEASESETGDEGCIQLIEACNKAFMFFDMGKKSLDGVTCFIALSIWHAGTNGPLLGITGISHGRAVISFICNNMDDCVPISPSPQLIKDCISSLLLADKQAPQGNPWQRPTWIFGASALSSPPNGGFCFLIPQTRDGAKLTVVMSIQTRSILMFFLCCSRYSKDQKRPFSRTCLNRV